MLLSTDSYYLHTVDGEKKTKIWRGILINQFNYKLSTKTESARNFLPSKYELRSWEWKKERKL